MVDNRDNNIWKVYVHILPKTITHHEYDKYYVGITRVSYKKRWGNNGTGYKRNKYFYRNIEKYGWDNIEHCIIAENLTRDEAEKLERTLIAKLNSTDNLHGFNMHPGGTGGEGYHPPIEVRKKISEHHADVSGGNNPFAKKVYQFTLNGVYINNYESVSIAGKQFNSKGRSISHAAIYNKMAFGYLWVYDDNIIKKNNTYELKEYKYVPKHLTNKRVFGFDKNTKELIYDFESCVIASRETNIKKENISGSACYKFKTSKTDNYIWRYEKDVGFTKDGKAYFIA